MCLFWHSLFILKCDHAGWLSTIHGAGALVALVPVAVDHAGEARADAEGMSGFIELLNSYCSHFLVIPTQITRKKISTYLTKIHKQDKTKLCPVVTSTFREVALYIVSWYPCFIFSTSGTTSSWDDAMMTRKVFSTSWGLKFVIHGGDAPVEDRANAEGMSGVCVLEPLLIIPIFRSGSSYWWGH